MTTDKSNVYSAVLEVMKAVGYVQKTGEMKSGMRYTYPTEGDLIRGLRPALIENNLLIFPAHYDFVESDTYPSTKDTLMRRVSIKATFVIYHAPSNTSIEVQAFGEGTDSGDKALFKAMTGALKYALRQPFIIETGDDPDNESSESQAETRKSNASTSKKKEPAKSASKAPTAEFDSDMMNKAMEYKVPAGLPQAGKALGQLVGDSPMGAILIGFLAGRTPDGSGKMFEATTDDEKKLSSAAAYIYDKNPTFAKTLKEFEGTVK